MKINKLLVAAFLGLALSAQSQFFLPSYNFSVSTDTYTNLTGSTSLNNGVTWDDPDYTIPISFNFQYFDSVITELHIRGMGGALETTTNGSGILSKLIPYGADLIDRGVDLNNPAPGSGTSLSNISYKIEGTVDSQILKIEWNNVGFLDEIWSATPGLTYFTNFQLWLYEETNDIEIHFGPNSIPNPSAVFQGKPGVSIAIYPQYDSNTWSILSNGIGLTGVPDSATSMYISKSDYSNGIIPNISGVIPNGTIYKFAKNNPDILISSITINGQSGDSTISTPIGTLQLYATILPSNATDTSVTWGVIPGLGSASINESGLLTAISDGNVVIMAVANDGSGAQGAKVITISNQSMGIKPQNNESFSIYPNPSDDYIMLSGEDRDIDMIRIVNVAGLLVKEIHNYQERIYVSDLNTGIYFIKVISNSAIKTKTFIKR